MSMGDLSWQRRLSIVLSAVWLVMVGALSSSEDNSLSVFIFLGVFPITLLWGIAWVWFGFRRQRTRVSLEATGLKSNVLSRKRFLLWVAWVGLFLGVLWANLRIYVAGDAVATSIGIVLGSYVFGWIVWRITKFSIREHTPESGYFIFVLALLSAAATIVRLENTEVHQLRSMQEAGEQAARNFEQEIKAAQSEATNNKSVTEALAERSQKYMTDTLNSATTEKRKQIAASNFFFGAYFLNTRARQNYCASLGFSINSFVNAYEEKHHDLFMAAERIQIRDFNEQGIAFDLEEFYKLMAPTAEKMIITDMKDAASALKISEREVCQSMEQNAGEWVNEMDYRKLAPEVAAILLLT